jgi:hypothetical protein
LISILGIFLFAVKIFFSSLLAVFS